MRKECIKPGCDVRPYKPSAIGLCSAHDPGRYPSSNPKPAMTEAEREARRQEIVDKFIAGARCSELAEHYELHTNTITRYTAPYREERDQYFKRHVRQLYYHEGLWVTEIANKLRVSIRRVGAAIPEDLVLLRKLRDNCLNRIVAIEEGCWIWTGNLAGRGYASFGFDGSNVYVHRLIYELCVGDIPEDMTIDHLCGVTFCVNPDHLQVLSREENTRNPRTDVSIRFDHEEPLGQDELVALHQDARRAYAKELREQMLAQLQLAS